MKMKMKMKTSEKIVRAKDLYMNNKSGMGYCFEGGYPILFNYYIAVLFFGAKWNCKYDLWWPASDKQSRIKYLDWMIRIYKFFNM